MGTLYVVSTPIGNLDDITIRAIKTLFSVDSILCEDTRRTGLLLQHLKNTYAVFLCRSPNLVNNSAAADKLQRLIRFDDHTENTLLPEIIDHLEGGQSVALVSDAGTPLISDPGFRLVRECVKRGIKLESVPGPSAFLTALTSSGLPADKFLFLGYPPEKSSHRTELFQYLLQMNRFICSTCIFYCAPHKLTQTLEDMKSSFGDIEVCVARELTKIHEETWKGALSQAISKYTDPKGEFVLLFRLPHKLHTSDV